MKGQANLAQQSRYGRQKKHSVHTLSSRFSPSPLLFTQPRLIRHAHASRSSFSTLFAFCSLCSYLSCLALHFALVSNQLKVQPPCYQEAV